MKSQAAKVVDAENTVPVTAVLLKRYPKLSETFILGELLGLESRGFRLHIFSLYPPSDQSSHPQCRQVQAPVTYLPDTHSLIKHYLPAHCGLFLRKPARYLRVLLSRLLARQPDEQPCFLMAGWLARSLLTANITHLHTHFINQPGSVAELVQALTAIPFSLSAHAKDIYLSSPGELTRKLSAARFTVTCSEYNQHYLQSLVDESTLIHRLYHGIDFSRLAPDENRGQDISGEIPLILSIGRLREKKGFHILIEACRVLKTRGSDFRCEIVGYGPDREKLQQHIHALDLQDHISLRGKLEHSDVISLFHQARLFVLPCIIGSDGDRDGIPNVILEALAMKVPVVATAISGIPEIIRHQETGLLVKQGDADALANALLRLLDNQSLGETLANAGHQRVKKMFSNDTNLRLLEQLLTASTQGSDSTGLIRKQEASAT